MLTWACLFGSNRSKQPTWWDCVWMIPAQTMLSGLGSMPSSSCIPKPESLILAPAKSSGIWALNTFWARCFSLKAKVKSHYMIHCSDAYQELTLRDSSTGRRTIRRSFQSAQRTCWPSMAVWWWSFVVFRYIGMTKRATVNLAIRNIQVTLRKGRANLLSHQNSYLHTPRLSSAGFVLLRRVSSQLPWFVHWASWLLPMTTEAPAGNWWAALVSCCRKTVLADPSSA